MLLQKEKKWGDDDLFEKKIKRIEDEQRNGDSVFVCVHMPFCR